MISGEVWNLANYFATAALVLIGSSGILLCNNLMRKLMAMNILQVGVIFFFISIAFKWNATAPILNEMNTSQKYINPLPHALMLTAIVVGVATTGVALALLIRIQKKFQTIEETEVLKRLRD